MARKTVLLSLIAVLFAAFAPAQAQENTNLTECVTQYDPAVEYFPEQVEIEYATGFTVEYHNHYKVITVSRPWAGADEADALQYLLVQCGTPTPEGFDDAQVIEVPVQRAISMSTTYLPYIIEYGLLDRLVGVDNASALYSSYPEIAALLEAGDLVDVGNTGAEVNVEVVLNAEPDLVMTYGSGSPEFDAHPVLLEAGIPVALNGDYAETDALGQAEWGKFVALFFNAEGQAQAAFDAEAERYAELAALTAEIPAEDRPLVLSGSYTSFGDAWYVPGGASFAALMLMDAGAELVLADDPAVTGATGGVPLDFETVYNAGLNADVWMPGAFAIATLDDLLAQDERYADFAAVQNGAVYNNDARVNANGGNAYYEEGAAHPSLILADLIAIFHPELLPDHELAFFRRLEAAAQ